MKKKKVGSLNGLGKGFLAAMLIGMIIRFYLKAPEETFPMRLLAGGVAILETFLGTGILLIALLVVFYCAIKAYTTFFTSDYTEDGLLEDFKGLTEPLTVISFVCSYIAVMIWM